MAVASGLPLTTPHVLIIESFRGQELDAHYLGFFDCFNRQMFYEAYEVVEDSVLGLSFGDCGKGHFVDALTRRWQAHTVVRFNGGAQAGHNVVTSADAGSGARHHTFSQFSAGTLVPGVRTLLLDPMVVHPTALLVEAEALGRIGVNDALSRLKIDGQCRVTTPCRVSTATFPKRGATSPQQW